MTDLERTFGVLQAHFAIVGEPARVWDEEMLGTIMLVSLCTI
jgi:hypothetical protein